MHFLYWPHHKNTQHCHLVELFIPFFVKEQYTVSSRTGKKSTFKSFFRGGGETEVNKRVMYRGVIVMEIPSVNGDTLYLVCL